MRRVLLELVYYGGEVSLPGATAAAYNLIRIPKILLPKPGMRRRSRLIVAALSSRIPKITLRNQKRES
jgi:hypothetical protein